MPRAHRRNVPGRRKGFVRLFKTLNVRFASVADGASPAASLTPTLDHDAWVVGVQAGITGATSTPLNQFRLAYSYEGGEQITTTPAVSASCVAGEAGRTLWFPVPIVLTKGRRISVTVTNDSGGTQSIHVTFLAIERVPIGELRGEPD